MISVEADYTVDLFNRVAKVEWPFESEEIREFFRFQPPGYFFSPKFKKKVWDGFISMMRGNRIPAGLFLAQKRLMEKHGLTFEIRDHRVRPKFKPLTFPKGWTPRPFQVECVSKMVKNSGTGGIILNATGTGKTSLMGLYFRRLEGRAVFVVDELTLLAQAREELSSVLGEKVGIIGQGKFEPERITVATIQTLSIAGRRKEFKKWKKDLDVLVIDEVHQMVNKRSQKVVKSLNPKTVFGLTATLELEKPEVAMPTYSLCGRVLFEYDYKTGTADGYLAHAVAIGVDLLRTHPKAKYEPYQDLYEDQVVLDSRRNGLVIDLVHEALKLGKHVAVIVERVRHLKELSKRLKKKGIRHRTVYGLKKVKDRIESKERFEAGECKVLLTNKVFKKGINLKVLDLIVEASQNASANDSRQKLGRGVRLSSEKRGLIYIDVGERKPKGAPAKNVNRFEKATKSRRDALAKQGVPVIPMRAKCGARKILVKAARELDLLLASRAVESVSRVKRSKVS